MLIRKLIPWLVIFIISWLALFSVGCYKLIMGCPSFYGECYAPGISELSTSIQLLITSASIIISGSIIILLIGAHYALLTYRKIISKRHH